MAYVSLGQEETPVVAATTTDPPAAAPAATPATTPATSAPSSAGPAPADQDLQWLVDALTSPWVASALTGLAANRIARAVDVAPNKAARVGFVAFGLSLASRLLTDYVEGKAKELAKEQG